MTPQSPSSSVLSTAQGGVAPEAGALGPSDGTAAISVLRTSTTEPAETQNADRGRTLGRHAGRLIQRRMLSMFGMRHHRLATCGFSMEPGRRFKVSGGKARSVGVERCGNARLCQVCGPAKATQRAAEVGAATWRWLTSSEDRAAYFVSIAASHTKADELGDLVSVLLDARADVMDPGCASWKAFRARHGIADLAWVLEVNAGANGAHPGLHLIVLTEHGWDAAEADRVEAWLCLAFRASMRALGFKGRLSAEHGIDVRPVDDPAGLGRYLTKWGIGSELAGEMMKLGRNGENVPYSAIPAVLAAEIGRQQLPAVMRRDRRVAWLVRSWRDYVELAISDRRKWYAGFHKLNDLVPELKGATTRNERVAICTGVLPEELRPECHDDAEQDDDEDAGGSMLLTVEPDVWAVAQRAWWRGDGLRLVPLLWRRMAVPLELVVCWLVEDQGIDIAAAALADLADAELVGTDIGLTVAYPRGDGSAV